MNCLRASFGIISILLQIHKISGGQGNYTKADTPNAKNSLHNYVNPTRLVFSISQVGFLYRNRTDAPLALIQEKNSSKLKLAIPQKVHQNTETAAYPYDDEEELFKTACPAYTHQQMKIENKWRKEADASKTSVLFFLVEYTDWKMLCQRGVTPGASIKNTNRGCGNSLGEIYEVGYPDIQFMAIYEICYSKDKSHGTIYTNHRIDSPNLMLLEVHNTYRPSMSKTFTSPLDQQLKKVEAFYKNKFIYQLVPRYDMPVMHWENATSFPFNYTSIGQNRKMLRNMMKYDNVVRLFSNKTLQPLTFYSGIYQKMTTIQVPGLFGTHNESVPINSFFWRVIINEENEATILITQYTEKPCVTVCNDFVLLEYYNAGGCTYKCSPSPEIINLLRLPELDFIGDLDIQYTSTVEPETKTTQDEGGVGGQSYTDAQVESTQVSISEFGDGASFAAALLAVDASTAAAMQAEGAFGSDSGHGNSDGNADDGGGDNGGSADGGVGE